jgi:hypothetical protein
MAGSILWWSKSCPFGLIDMLFRIASTKGSSLLGLARKMGIKSTLSSCPKHKYNSPLHVILTRLQLSQKLCVWGEMKPILV